MTDYGQDFARFLAESGALFFASGLKLKDGRPTPYFVNLGQINTGPAALTLARFYARMLVAENLIAEGDVLIGPSYKGCALAPLTTAALWLDHKLAVGFDYDRKEVKTHGEASGGQKAFVTGAVSQAQAGLILDDVATSLKTKVELLDKIRRAAPRIEIKAVVIGVDREQTQPVYDSKGRIVAGVKGEDAIDAFVNQTGIPVRAVVKIRQVVDHLYQTGLPVMIDGIARPLGEADKKVFEDYLSLYGRA